VFAEIEQGRYFTELLVDALLRGDTATRQSALRR
jgi:hypothetical protein